MKQKIYNANNFDFLSLLPLCRSTAECNDDENENNMHDEDNDDDEDDDDSEEDEDEYMSGLPKCSV